MAFTESAGDFLDTTHGFAVSATVDGSPVNGIFDNEYFDDTVGAQMGADSSQPAFLCAAADVSSATINSTVVIGATTYKVTSVQPDGTLMTRLVMEKQ